MTLEKPSRRRSDDTPSERATSPIGQRAKKVDLTHRDDDRGSDNRIVVLDAGFRDDSAWNKVTGDLRKIARLQVFDRTGSSDSSASDSRRERRRFDEFFQFEQSDDSLVLVGWALGTLYARAYAIENPGKVGGLVLADPVPFSLVRELVARFDEGERRDSRYASELLAEIARAHSDSGFYDVLDADSGDLFSVPQIHILRGERPLVGDILGERWVEIQQRDRAGCMNVREVIAGRSGEHIPRDRPDVIVAAVRDLLYRDSD